MLLFTPPFDRTPLDPGYIKGYPPGIRENGGQYTHAALWSVMAFAMLGDGDKAGEPVRACSIRSITPAPARTSSATRSSPTSSPPTSIPCRPMSAAAAGRGTLAPPPGCSAPGWKASWECGWRAIASASIPAYPKRGLASSSLCGAVRHDMRFASKIRREVEQGVVFAAMDGAEITAQPPRLLLVDDGASHRIRHSTGMNGQRLFYRQARPGPSIRSRIGRRHCRMTSFPFSPQPG